MRILMIADINSIHVYTYIRVVLEQIKDINIVLLDLDSNNPDNVNVHRYYKNNPNIEVISISKFEPKKMKILKRVPKISTIIWVFSIITRIKKFEKFDYCILQYVNKIKALATLGMISKIKRVVPVFWGSDLLRSTQIDSFVYELLFKKSHKIVFNTEHMYNQFKKKYRNKFKMKSEIIKFPLLSFSEIDNLERKLTVSEMKRNMSIPSNKYIVVCGHSGSSAENHEELINAIVKCNRELLDKCFFVFPMTYGYNASLQVGKVADMLKKYNLHGKVYDEYLEKSKMLKLMISADVFISVISTDAFSAVMQENIYTSSIVIHGEWLKYLELDDMGIYRYAIKEISDLTKVLENVINSLPDEKQKCNNNKQMIYNISAPEKISDAWCGKIFI